MNLSLHFISKETDRTSDREVCLPKIEFNNANVPHGT